MSIGIQARVSREGIVVMGTVGGVRCAGAVDASAGRRNGTGRGGRVRVVRVRSVVGAGVRAVS